MAKATQLPSGAWRVQVSTGEKDALGRYKYVSITMPTEDEANFAALEYKLGKRRNDESMYNITLNEAITRYIASKDAILSPTTIKEYKYEQSKYIQGLMNIKINKLTQEAIQREFNKESRLYSPKTIRNVHCLLSAVLKEYRPEFTLRTLLPQKQKSNITIPEADDIIKIIAAVKGTNIELAVLLALCLGMRRSEICGLKWTEVDLKKKVINIKSALVLNENGEYVDKQPKSYAGNRILPVPGFIAELLEKQNRENEYVVPLRGDYIYKKFSKVLKANDISHMRFHDLRHANASLMLALNIPDKYAMERMGHATNSTLKNIYQHTLNKEKDNINNMINSYFENVINSIIT